MLKIAIDVMGADNGVTPIVQGVLQALESREFIAIIVGDEAQITPLILNGQNLLSLKLPRF